MVSVAQISNQCSKKEVVQETVIWGQLDEFSI